MQVKEQGERVKGEERVKCARPFFFSSCLFDQSSESRRKKKI